jgi:CO/xanthine dehydrogenase FAD-binding subunit
LHFTVSHNREPGVDLNQISEIAIPRDRTGLAGWRRGDAWLAGGTWLFSEPQPDLRRLVDLTALDWPPLTIGAEGLRIAATCTIARLNAAVLPTEWAAARLVPQCCRSLLGSFKIWNMATVGGNICMALPAGPMTSLTAALDGVATIWAPNGGERLLPITDLVLGPRQTALRPGEVVRQIDISAEAMRRRTAFRRISLNPVGRSGALVIGTLAAGGAFTLTVTAATRRPVQLRFDTLPEAAALATELAQALPDALYYDDIHGRPDWRRAMTEDFAEQIRLELAMAA